MRHSSALSRAASPADSHDESTRAPEWREPPAHESHSALSDRTLMPVLVVCELDHSVEALARDPDDRTGRQAAAATSRGDRGAEQGRSSCLTPTGGCQRLPAFTGELGLDLESLSDLFIEVMRKKLPFWVDGSRSRDLFHKI